MSIPPSFLVGTYKCIKCGKLHDGSDFPIITEYEQLNKVSYLCGFIGCVGHVRKVSDDPMVIYMRDMGQVVVTSSYL